MAVTKQPKFERLKAQLATSGLRQENPALYQVIEQLISALIQEQIVTSSTVSSAVAVDLSSVKNRNYLTHTDESVNLPNSRRLLAGTFVTFDDSIANQRTVNVSASLDREWSVLTNGNSVTPELMWDSNGDVIMTEKLG